MDKQLRIMTAAIIVESKLSKPAKQQLLQFVKEQATDAQVKALLMDGKIVKLDRQAEQLVNERFEVHPVKQKVVQEGVLKTILGMILLTPGGWLVWRGLKAALSEKQRRCGILAIGATRDACLIAAKIEIAKRTIALLKKESPNCAQSKNPDKCKAAIEKEIAKQMSIIQKAEGKLQKTKASVRAAAKEKAADPNPKGF